MFDNYSSGAEFSECRKYRYGLWRIWDESKPKIMFIGLNPSTASEEMDDPTIRRVKRFAADWGYGGVYMANLFAFVTAYPKELLSCADPVADNDKWIKYWAELCKDVLFAWGNFQEAQKRYYEIVEMFPKGLCLGVNKNQTPKHPLYISAKTKPVPYSFYTKPIKHETGDQGYYQEQ